MSKGEDKIVDILNKENIRFVREKTFRELKRRSFLRFDFYLPELGCLIEFNGRQHYERVAKFQKTEADFKKQQEYDRRKISYCLANNIPLYIIPYWDLENIHTAGDLIQDKYCAKTKWHNDKVAGK